MAAAARLPRPDRVKPTAGKILATLRDPTTVALEPGFTRDMRKIGHYGTGDLEVTIARADDPEWPKPLFEMSSAAS